jgi:hypothetical protein
MSSKISSLIDEYDPKIQKLIIEKLKDHKCNKYYDIDYENLNCFPPQVAHVSADGILFDSYSMSEDGSPVKIKYDVDLSEIFNKKICFENKLQDYLFGYKIDELVYRYDGAANQLYLDEISCYRLFPKGKGYRCQLDWYKRSYFWNSVKRINDNLSYFTFGLLQ